MNNKLSRFCFLFCIIFFLFLCISNPVGADNTDLVYKISINGDIDPGLYSLTERGIAEAEELGVDLILIEIDTYGGYVDSAVKIRDLILSTNIPTATYVKRRAWSAGALIALAGEKLLMAEGSSIGAAETRPNDEKYISAFRKEFKATAESRGKNPDLAAAMVDSDIEIEGIVSSGKLLTLTVDEALEYEIADFKAKNEGELFKKLDIYPSEIKTIEFSMTEKAARVITRPTITTLLITIGILALLAEAFISGFGVFGTVGFLSLGAVFSSYIYYGVAGWGLAVLFVVGIVLIAIEIFAIPGFGITGIGGIIAIFASIYFLFPRFDIAITAIATILLLSVAGFIVMLKLFGGSRLWKRISLGESQTKEAGYLAQSDKKALTGKIGLAATPLRPAGIVDIEGERIDVVSEGGFIGKGEEVIIYKIAGNRIVVKKTKEG